MLYLCILGSSQDGIQIICAALQWWQFLTKKYRKKSKTIFVRHGAECRGGTFIPEIGQCGQCGHCVCWLRVECRTFTGELSGSMVATVLKMKMRQ